MKVINIQNELTTVQKMIEYFEKATLLAKEIGVDNITQAGLIKEMKMAEVLGHNVISDKHCADAIDQNGSLYEYLSCQVSAKTSVFAIDGLFSRPLERMEQTLEHRISRNAAFFCGTFDGVFLKKIYKVDTEKFFEYTRDSLTRRDQNGKSKNSEHTINYPLKWIESVGKIVYNSEASKEKNNEI